MKTQNQSNLNSKKTLSLLLSVVSLVFCEVTFAQVPYIGSDSSFALFTSVGAFGNTGTTVIWGDAGTNAGAYTGSQTVNGNVYVANSISSIAAQDLQNAYSQMAAFTCDSTIGTPFGGGLTLSPGKVYCLTTASTLNGNLILDAGGNPSAIFRIKINGALTTTTNSNVILTNSANFCKVYWQIGGAVDLGINSTFKGTILADGAISLLDGATLDGRGLTRAGLISLNNNTVVGCDASGAPLPVNLISFKATLVESAVQLNWTTASELNNDYFTLLRSTDGVSFEEILRVTGSGNTNTIRHYEAMDQQPFSGTSFYRLQQTDYDGMNTFSDVIVVRFKKIFPYTIYPNPFHTKISILMSDISQEKDHCEWKLYNTLGEELMTAELTERLTTLTARKLNKGVYFYKIFCDSEIVQSGRIFMKY